MKINFKINTKLKMAGPPFWMSYTWERNGTEAAMSDIHGPKPYKFIGFGDIHGPKPYKIHRVW